VAGLSIRLLLGYRQPSRQRAIVGHIHAARTKVCGGVLNGRIYRAAFLPLLFALAIAGFSLTGRTPPLGSSLTPDAFEGARAFATLEALAEQFPERRPGGAGDRRLAAYVAQELRGLGSAAKGGFAVSTRSVQAQTIDGKRTLTTVIAQRSGTTGEAPIVILAHRDAAGRGAQAELSGTAALLELARVLAASETQRAIVLVSTSGGSGGNAGAADFAAHAGELVGMAQGGGAGSGRADGTGTGTGAGVGEAGAGVGGAGAGVGGAGSNQPIDAALVLGDLAGTSASGPLLSSFSASAASAPALLRSTVAQAISQQVGASGGEVDAPGTLAQLAHLIFPLAGGEQGPLGARGLPAVLVGAGGEAAPPANQPVSAARLEAFGRAVLATVYALDNGPEIGGGEASGGGLESGLPIQHKAIPAWALRLLVATLLLPALLALLDGFARLRRRRVAIGRWVVWALACGLPFLLCAVFAILLGTLGAIPAPLPPVSPAALPFARHAWEAVLATLLVLVLAWLAWPALMRRLGLPVRPHTDAAAFAMLLVLGGLTVVVWAFDPLTALLLVPALNLWLILLAAPPSLMDRAGSRFRGSRMQALALVALGVAPLALLVFFDAGQLDLGPGGVAHTALLLLASGRVGLAGAVLWSVAFGCLAAALMAAIAREDDAEEPQEWPDDDNPIRIRGPLSYAGPGSLAEMGIRAAGACLPASVGTESALRR
jgi:hypothetical protein